MLKLMKNTLTAIALVIIVNVTLFAQAPSPAAQPRPEDNYVTEKGFKSKVFTITSRDVNQLSSVLKPLLSGFKGAMIVPNSEFKTLTVRDFPENIATVEEAIKRLDMASAARPNIELHMHVLFASNSARGNAELPVELRDVLAQLRGTFNYKNYELATSIVQRLTETPRGLRGKGVAEFGGQTGATTLPYDYSINNVSLSSNPSSSSTIQINEFAFVTMAPNGTVSSQIETALNLRDGEKVVVGTATLRDRALIIVLSAKLIN